MKVLIVEDMKRDRDVLCYNFKGRGHDVIEAANGEEALALAAEHLPDLIVSDALMPVMDGFQLLMKIKQDPRLASIPFVFYSAVYTGDQEEELALSLGARAFIVKPKDPDEFWHELDVVLLASNLPAAEELPPPVETEEFLTSYSHIVATRLEEKVRELEQTKAEIEHRVAERTAELAEANRELEIYNAAISHDLRAPLGWISGFAKILYEDCAEKLDDKDKQNLERIMRGCRQMSAMVDALHDLSQLSRGEILRQETDLTRLAGEIATRLKGEEPERRVTVRIADGLIALCDARLMLSVLENLLQNAWKFTKDRADAVIEFGSTCQGGELVFFVRDNGAGFDMRYADKLFAPFGRLHHVEDFPGTGMGLATVSRIIQRHGGKIWAEGNPGEGAVFYFTIPQSEL